ncbi:hypothetical protein D9M71_775560 [compost metagenome]
MISTTVPFSPGFSPFSSSSTWSARRNGRVVKIRKVQNTLDNTLHAAKNATAPTAAKPVKAVHSTDACTPTRSSTASAVTVQMMKLDSRRMASSMGRGRV